MCMGMLAFHPSSQLTLKSNPALRKLQQDFPIDINIYKESPKVKKKMLLKKRRQDNQTSCKAALLEEVRYTERIKDCRKEHSAAVSQLCRNLIKDGGRTKSREAGLIIPALRWQRQENHEEEEKEREATVFPN